MLTIPIKRGASRQLDYILIIAAMTLSAPAAFARPVQLLVQPSEKQMTGMTHGVQIVVSEEAGSEVRMMTPEPGDDDRIQLAFLFVNRSNQAANIGPENVTATTLSLVSYDQLVDEQRRRESRKKFGNFLWRFGNALSAADAGKQHSSFNYNGTYSDSGITSGGGFYSGMGSVSGSGSITTYDPYVEQLTRAQVRAENQVRTEEMFRSFAAARSALGVNLRTTTVMPYQQLGGVLTFDLPRSLRKASSSQPFAITIQVGSDRHVLNGFVGPTGTLPAITPSPMTLQNAAAMQDSATDSRLRSDPLKGAPSPAQGYVTPRSALNRDASAAQLKAERTTTTASVTIEAFHQGQYAGQPEPIAALAKQGFAPAQNELGMLYQQGRGVPQNNTEAIRLFRLAAAQGMRDAQANLAWMYENGQGVTRNIAMAKRYYGLAADQGDRIASVRLNALMTGR